ncbi:MAG: cation:proton antiporter [Chloroflexota bacterium]
MPETGPAILEIGVVLLAAAAAGWTARRVGLPAIVGYLAVGLVVSPFTPGYVADRHQLQLLADVGVVLLLFEVGIEVDVARIRREQGALLVLAPLQTVLTTAVAGLAFAAAGIEPAVAGLLGLAIAFSSSVVIVNITRSRRRTTDRPTEDALLGWSVLQDITGVAIAAALIAVVAPTGRPVPLALAGLAAFGALAVVAAFVLPRALRRLRNDHDLFLIVSVAVGLAVAGIGSVVFGMPLALAAFVAGLALGESHDASEARRRLLPFRDVFAVLFFVTVGTLIDPSALGTGLGWLALAIGLVIVAKVVPIMLLARVGRVHARPVQLGIGLGQLGEFSFVLASVALAAGRLDTPVYAGILGAVVVTIVLSTVVVRLVGQPVPAVPPA